MVIIACARVVGEAAMVIVEHSSGLHRVIGINVDRPSQAVMRFGVAQTGKDPMQLWSSCRQDHQLKSCPFCNASHGGRNGAENIEPCHIPLALCCRLE